MKLSEDIIEKVLADIKEALEKEEGYEVCEDDACDDEMCHIYQKIQLYVYYHILEHPYEKYRCNEFNIIKEK